ncbi:MAG: aryl-sulfate sulfotransferase [Bacteroidetes bacterium]|nr:aryl-sulfate sulfotransferase [Bacteroidota bacterium]
MGNKLIADGHDLLILPNGNYVFTIKVPQTADMTQYGGNPSATVVHGMIQELDINKNVVWEWRSWDHIPIDDTNNPLTDNNVRLNHFNTLGVTNDGSYIMGNRVNSEALIIDRVTGELIWRFGGRDKQFTFIGDNDNNNPNYFSPHDIRMLPNGNITLFDNGNNHSPWFSRAVEYQVDQVNKTATQVWEYRHKPFDIANRNQGSVQRLPNGNTLISWGGRAQDSTSADITEVTPDGTITFELTLPTNSASYRALKYPWNINKPSASVIINNIVAGSNYNFNNSNDSTGFSAKVNSLNGPEINKFSLKRFNLAPVFPEFSITPFKVYTYRLFFSSLIISSVIANLEFELSSFPLIKDPAKVKIYVRVNEGMGLFTPLTTIYDSVNSKLIVNNAGFGEYIFADDNSIVTGIETNKILPKYFSLSQNFPNPFNPTTTIEYSIHQNSFVNIVVYDVLGKVVQTLVNEEKTAGNYKITFNAKNLSSGIYFYTMKAGNFIEAKKLVLLK